MGLDDLRQHFYSAVMQEKGENDERPLTHEKTVPGGDYISPSQPGPSPTTGAVPDSAQKANRALEKLCP